MADKNIQMTQRNEANTAWDNLHPKTKAENVQTQEGTDLQTEIDSLKSSVSDGKTQVRDVITGKGATVSDADGDGVSTFQELTDGLNSLDRGSQILTPSTTNQAIIQGYHDGLGYVKGDTDLKASNILSGKNIFGVAGTVASGGIKSIQRGILLWADDVNSMTVTISPVVVGNSIVRIGLKSSASLSKTVATWLPSVTLHSSGSSINVRTSFTTGFHFIEFAYEVIEFNELKSRQTGSYTNVYDESSTKDVSISTVDVNKSLIFWSYRSSGSKNNYARDYMGSAYTSSPTNARFHLLGDEDYDEYVEWQVVEFN